MSSSRPKPKRPSGLDPRPTPASNSKRPKFDLRNPHSLAADAPDETDVFLEVDAGAVGKERGTRGRNRVDVEGYESDSSDEGFDNTRERWRKTAQGEGDGDGDGDADGDDMFAEVKDDVEDAEGVEGKEARQRDKGVGFMELEDIEGQEFATRREFVDIIDEDKGDGDSDDVEEQEIDPEIGEGGRKKGAPKMDAFNMRNEMDEGKFDEAGNFIRKAAEKDAVHDSWLEGVSRKDMRRAKEAMVKREAEEMQKMKEDDAIATSEVLADLIVCLEKGESILEALARLGSGDKKQGKKNSWRQKRKVIASNPSEDMDIDSRSGFSKGKESLDPAEARRKETIEKITGAADRLLTRGQPEVYDESRESLIRQYRRESGEDWADRKPSTTVADQQSGRQWEYRWTDGRDGYQIYGPYDGTAMTSWNQHGFFGQGVEFRAVGGNWTFVADFE